MIGPYQLQIGARNSTYRGYNSRGSYRPFIGVRIPFITIVGAHCVKTSTLSGAEKDF